MKPEIQTKSKKEDPPNKFDPSFLINNFSLQVAQTQRYSSKHNLVSAAVATCLLAFILSGCAVAAAKIRKRKESVLDYTPVPDTGEQPELWRQNSLTSEITLSCLAEVCKHTNLGTKIRHFEIGNSKKDHGLMELSWQTTTALSESVDWGKTFRNAIETSSNLAKRASQTNEFLAFLLQEYQVGF